MQKLGEGTCQGISTGNVDAEGPGYIQLCLIMQVPCQDYRPVNTAGSHQMPLRQGRVADYIVISLHVTGHIKYLRHQITSNKTNGKETMKRS